MEIGMMKQPMSRDYSDSHSLFKGLGIKFSATVAKVIKSVPFLKSQLSIAPTLLTRHCLVAVEKYLDLLHACLGLFNKFCLIYGQLTTMFSYVFLTPSLIINTLIHWQSSTTTRNRNLNNTYLKPRGIIWTHLKLLISYSICTDTQNVLRNQSSILTWQVWVAYNITWRFKRTAYILANKSSVEKWINIRCFKSNVERILLRF